MALNNAQSEQVRDYVLTAIFLVIALILMVWRTDGGLHNTRKVSVAALSYLDQPLANFRIYREALQTNTELREQNVLLLDELSRLRSAREENEILREQLGFMQNEDHNLLPVTIVSKNLTGVNNSLTINAGSNQGVRIGMPLITSDGLVGRVTLVTNNFSQVMPFSNPLFRVSARVQGSRAFGVVSWESERISEVIMNFVPQTIPVSIGSVIETSGSSAEFPAHIPIGVVEGTAPEIGRETQKIYIRPFVSLSEIAEGFVLLFTPDEELTGIIETYERQFR